MYARVYTQIYIYTHAVMVIIIILYVRSPRRDRLRRVVAPAPTFTNTKLRDVREYRIADTGPDEFVRIPCTRADLRRRYIDVDDRALRRTRDVLPKRRSSSSSSSSDPSGACSDPRTTRVRFRRRRRAFKIRRKLVFIGPA